MSLEPGTKVGRYTITRQIAQGGMAEVYRAEQDLTGGITRPVAVKVIRPEYSESEDFRGMFLDEARTACTLSHPNIVHIYEVGESDDGLLYMAMELVAGETLATVNRTLRDYDERMGEEALFAIGIHTCSALEAVHALKVEGGFANLVHRDVSPHNLLMSTSGGLKLIDFGIAKAASNRNLTMPGVTKGKAGYFSPEQAMGKKLDGRSDLFSLGVTLYKLAYGGTPFDDHKNHAERHAALVRGQWKQLDEVYPGLPQGFYAVLRRSLQVRPEDRFSTAREMREALEKAAFDARVRVTQSSLEGFLDEAGEVTASGGPRAPAEAMAIAATSTQQLTAVGPAASSNVVAAPNEHSVRGVALKPLPPPKSNRNLLIGAFAAAVLAGVAATVVMVTLTQEPPPPEPIAVVPTRAPEVVVAKVEPLPAPVVKETVIDAGEETIELELTPEPLPRLPTPKQKTPKLPVVTTVQPKEKPKNDPPPPKEKDEAIPEGEGKLVVNVTGGSGDVVVDGSRWDTTPVQNKLPSGTHRVTVKLPDGQSAVTRVAVWPDKTTRLTLDSANMKWSQSQ